MDITRLQRLSSGFGSFTTSGIRSVSPALTAPALDDTSREVLKIVFNRNGSYLQVFNHCMVHLSNTDSKLHPCEGGSLLWIAVIDSNALKVINQVPCRCTSYYCADTALLCTECELTHCTSLRHLGSISGQYHTDNRKLISLPS